MVQCSHFCFGSFNTHTLAVRREKLCLKFAKDCVRNDKLHDMFPESRKSHLMDMRQNYKFVVKKARTERLQRSAAKVTEQRCFGEKGDSETT